MAAIKLWLQVLFLQGYLWRARFPEGLSDEQGEGRYGGSVLPFAIGLLAFGSMVIRIALGHGSFAFDALFMLLGMGLALQNIAVFRPARFVGSHAFWVSVIWGSSVVTTAALVALLVNSVVRGQWVWMPVLCGLTIFALAQALNSYQRRFLFFVDTNHYRRLLEHADVNILRYCWIRSGNYLARYPLQCSGSGPPQA